MFRLLVLATAVLGVASAAHAADLPVNSRLGAIFATPPPMRAAAPRVVVKEEYETVFAPEVDIPPLVNGYYGKPRSYLYRSYYGTSPDLIFERLPYASDALVDFYDEALTALGALCERTWHDRLEVVADGTSARLWNDAGDLHEVELWFPAPDDTAPREAAKEVFPGCPLTFRLAEALRPAPGRRASCAVR